MHKLFLTLLFSLSTSIYAVSKNSTLIFITSFQDWRMSPYKNGGLIKNASRELLYSYMKNLGYYEKPIEGKIYHAPKFDFIISILPVMSGYVYSHSSLLRLYQSSVLDLASKYCHENKTYTSCSIVSLGEFWGSGFEIENRYQSTLQYQVSLAKFKPHFFSTKRREQLTTSFYFSLIIRKLKYIEDNLDRWDSKRKSELLSYLNSLDYLILKEKKIRKMLNFSEINLEEIQVLKKLIRLNLSHYKVHYQENPFLATTRRSIGYEKFPHKLDVPQSRYATSVLSSQCGQLSWLNNTIVKNSSEYRKKVQSSVFIHFGYNFQKQKNPQKKLRNYALDFSKLLEALFFH